MNFKLFQVDVKNAFLNGYIQNKIYIDQPPYFIKSTFHFPIMFPNSRKPIWSEISYRVWYDRLFLLENEENLINLFFIKKFHRILKKKIDNFNLLIKINKLMGVVIAQK